MSDPEQILIQASAVAIGGRALIIAGKPGSGKSTLTLELIDRGAALIGDDGLLIELRDGGLTACPPPNIAGKLEVRGLGIFELPCTAAPASLVLDLDTPPERYPTAPATREFLGVALPCLPFDASGGAAALRAEWALSRYGK